MMDRIFELIHKLVALGKEAAPLLLAAYTAFVHWRSRQHSRRIAKIEAVTPNVPSPEAIARNLKLHHPDKPAPRRKK